MILQQHQLCGVRILLRVFHQRRTLWPCLTSPLQQLQCHSTNSCHNLPSFGERSGQEKCTIYWTSNRHLVSSQSRQLSLMTLFSKRYLSRFPTDYHNNWIQQQRHIGHSSYNVSQNQSGWFGDKYDARHPDKLKLDFDEENDLQELLEKCKTIIDSEDFRVAANVQQQQGSLVDLVVKMEHLVKHLCLCQCSPDNVLHFLHKNHQILMMKPSWSVLQKVVFFLEEIGMRRGHMLKALDNHNILWNSEIGILRKRLGLLRSMGFGSDLQKVVAKWPQILTHPAKQMHQMVEELRKNDFSKDEIKVIICDHPQILKDSPEDLAMKCQYVHFCMGITDDKDLVHSKVFKYSLDHIRTRHILLDRMGIFRTPDKHKVRSARNPRLGMIIDSSDRRFCAKVAGISEEDYEIFKSNLKDELEEMGVRSGSDEEEGEGGGSGDEDGYDSDDDDDTDDGGEYSDSDEEDSNSGYNR